MMILGIFLIILCVKSGVDCSGCRKKEWIVNAICAILGNKEYHGVKDPVIFSANLANHHVTKGNDHLVFSKVIANEGNGYNPSTGTFICKVPGLYQFNWIVHQTSGAKGLAIQLMHNHGIAFTMYLSHENGNLPGTTYLKLKSGDKVWLRAVNAGRKLYAINFTTFSGMLVKRSQ